MRRNPFHVLRMTMKHKSTFYETYIKRLLDILLSGLALIVLSPVLLVVAVLVKIKLGRF